MAELVLDRERYGKTHEVFEGNRRDRRTVSAMLESLQQRMGGERGCGGVGSNRQGVR